MIYRNKRLAALVFGLACIGTAGTAQAGWGWFSTCNGTPVGWAGGFRMERNRCSMPDNSNAHVAYNNAAFHWSKVTSRMDPNWAWDSCTITYGNGRSQTAIVPRAQISGFNGLTTCKTNGCIFSEDYTECDVRLANDLSYAPQDESFFNWSNSVSGANVIVHEYGHVLGINDRPLTSGEFNVMRGTQPGPVTGGNGTAPYPDDAQGVRIIYTAVYGGSVSSQNLFTSAQKITGNAVTQTNNQGTINVCRGSAISVSYTIANNGTADQTSGFRVYINQTAVAGSGANIFVATAFNPKHSWATETKNLTIPANNPLGIHWIFWQIDTGGAVSEYTEADNHVHSAMTINVIAC